jgi:hypothetical protein
MSHRLLLPQAWRHDVFLIKGSYIKDTTITTAATITTTTTTTTTTTATTAATTATAANNSVQFLFICLLTQQPKGQLQSKHD